jgi:hypothetical protein
VVFVAVLVVVVLVVVDVLVDGGVDVVGGGVLAGADIATEPPLALTARAVPEYATLAPLIDKDAVPDAIALNVTANIC